MVTTTVPLKPSNAKSVAKVIIVVHRHALAMVLYIYGRGESAWHEFVL